LLVSYNYKYRFKKYISIICSYLNIYDFDIYSTGNISSLVLKHKLYLLLYFYFLHRLKSIDEETHIRFFIMSNVY